MLSRIDRVMVTAADAAATAQRFVVLLDAQIERTDYVAPLKARRVVVRVGDAAIEVLEPDGTGPVTDHLATGRGGPFAAGFAAVDIHRLRRQLAERGIVPTNIGHEQHFIDGRRLGIPGIHVVISPDVPQPRIGLLQNLYEVTHLTDDPAGAAKSLASLFALDPAQFVPIRSEQFGYEGLLTLFHGERLHRVETIHPHDGSKTMGRFFGRNGHCLYMCYGETDRLPELRDRLKSLAQKDWTGSDDNNDGLFIHPRALGGTMVGVSRTSYAWTWSGHPERVRPA